MDHSARASIRSSY